MRLRESSILNLLKIGRSVDRFFNKFRKLQSKAELFKKLAYSMLLKFYNSMN